MWGLSYWVFPLFSSVVWLAMLLGMFLTWILDGKPLYSSMQPGQHIAYISDIGADKLKPLFIAMSSVVVVSFDISFIAERWLRHTGRLAHNTSRWQKTLSVLTIIFAIVGAAGLILLSIFDTKRHPRLHDVFLVLFIGGYIICAVFVCWEYQRLGIHYRQFRILRMSFWVKLTFIFVELGLAVGFAVSNKREHWNTAAILEWVIALIYTFFVLSFFMDFIPAVRTKGNQSHETEEQMATRQSAAGYHDPAIERANHVDEYNGGHADHYNAGRHYRNGNTANAHATNGYSNGTGAGYENGAANGYAKPANGVPPARNF